MSKRIRIEIKIPLRVVTILIITILFAGLLTPVFANQLANNHAPEDIPDVVGGGQQLEWNVIERGPDFIRRQNTIDTNQYSWESAPQWVETCCSNYVPYIYNETDDYYQVRSGLIGARIFKAGHAQFWDPDMTEVRVEEERWIVQYYDDSKSNPKQWRWKVCDTYNPIISVSEIGNNINITVSFITDYPNSGERAFEVKYIFREGRSLKHEITFTNYADEEYKFRVSQMWDGIAAAKVKHDKGEDIVSSPIVVNSSQFRFLKEDNSLSIHEDQWDMYYGYDETTHWFYVLENECLMPVKIELGTSKGLKANFTFGFWTLNQSDSLEIDPATFTNDDTTIHGSIHWEYEDPNPPFYDRQGQPVFGRFEPEPGSWSSERMRTFFEWDVSGIPDTAIITNTVFKYAGDFNDIDGHVNEMLGVQPSAEDDDEEGNQNIYDEINEGTTYVDPAGFPVVGDNKQIDLGTDADTDLQSQLSVDWFAIGVEPDSDTIHISAIDDYLCTPMPTLYVVYTPPTTQTQTFMSTTTIGTTVCIYTVIQVIIDPLTTVTVTSESYTTLTTESITVCDTDTDTIHETECETETDTETETGTTTTTTSTSVSSTVTVLTFCTTITIPTSCTTISTTSCETSSDTLTTTTTTCSTTTWCETTTYLSTVDE